MKYITNAPSLNSVFEQTFTINCER